MQFTGEWSTNWGRRRRSKWPTWLSNSPKWCMERLNPNRGSFWLINWIDGSIQAYDPTVWLHDSCGTHQYRVIRRLGLFLLCNFNGSSVWFKSCEALKWDSAIEKRRHSAIHMAIHTIWLEVENDSSSSRGQNEAGIEPGDYFQLWWNWRGAAILKHGWHIMALYLILMLSVIKFVMKWNLMNRWLGSVFCQEIWDWSAMEASILIYEVSCVWLIRSEQ